MVDFGRMCPGEPLRGTVDDPSQAGIEIRPAGARDEYDGPAGASIFVVELNAGGLFAAHGQHCHEPNLRSHGRRRVASFDRTHRSCVYSRRAAIVVI